MLTIYARNHTQFSSVRCLKQARGMGLYFQIWESYFFVGFCVPSGSVMVKRTHKGAFGLQWGSRMGELASLGCTPSNSRSYYSFYCSLVTICHVPRAKMISRLASLRCTPMSFFYWLHMRPLITLHTVILHAALFSHIGLMVGTSWGTVYWWSSWLGDICLQYLLGISFIPGPNICFNLV